MNTVTFDVNGTLLDPEAIDAALELPPGEGLAVRALDDAIAQSMTDALAGDHRPFSSYLVAALRRRLALGGLGESRLGAAREVAAAMPAYADALPALARLRGAGFRLAALSNSAREDAEWSLEHAGLREAFDCVTGSDEVGTFKPAPAMYERSLAKLGVPAAGAWMLAAHGWDLLGARRAGMRTAWVSRKELILLETVPEPDVRAASLLDAAKLIVAGASARSRCVEILYFDGCPSYARLLPRLRELVAEAGRDPQAIALRPIETADAAQRERFLGSPTVRVDGADVDPTAAGREDFGLKCRIYRSPAGQAAVPPERWIRAALGPE
ncbi:MAG: hypothetical protein NVSMB51_12050 [Solirubrobacteraceae bacterium]